MASISEINAEFKVCIFGEGGVGKTSLARKYLTGIFEVNTQLTMGAQIFVKFLEIENINVSLQIWDFGGEEQFSFLLPAYSVGSSAGIFMFDLTRYNTMKRINKWIHLFNSGIKNETKEIPMILVGGKRDLEKKRAVDETEAKQLAQEYKCIKYLESSAVTGENIGVIFDEITRAILKINNLI